MKPGIILTSALFLLSLTNGYAQHPMQNEIIRGDTSSESQRAEVKNRMNFFIVSKPKKLLDPPTRFNILRAKIKSLLRPKKFSCIVTGSVEEMTSKVLYRLNKRNAIIGSLWFDSHGSYAKGYSFFTIGNNEINHKNISDSTNLVSFSKLVPHCDTTTKIGIGSCYGGATYSKPTDSGAAIQRMYGDSLMQKMGMMFPTATIYACESWVMTKPGLFKEKFAMAGFPLRRKFKDISFEPVWSRLGMWNSYQAATNEIKSVNCITLSKYGDIKIRFNSYQSLERVKKKMANGKSKLKPNMLKA